MTEETKPQVVSASRTLMSPQNLAEAMQLAQTLAKSDIVPSSFKGRPENILIAIGMGSEVGLNPFQALQSIMVVNGRPTLWGDAVLGIVQASGLLEYCEETFDPKTNTATCKMKRRNDPVEVVRSFSYDDAKKAGLLSKPGPWQQYPARMAQMRARSFAARDKFADFLRGLQVREEVEDYTETTATEVESLPLRKSGMSVNLGPTGVEVKVEPAVPVITTEERKELAELAADKGITPEVMKAWLKKYAGVESSKDLPKDKLEEIKNLVVNGEEPPSAA